MNKFKSGDKVMPISVDYIEYSRSMEELLGRTLVVHQVSKYEGDSELVLAGIPREGEWTWRAEDLRLVPETPADEVLHYWAVIDKNGKRVGGFSDSIAAAATDLSRSVEELLRDGYSFQQIAATIRPVATVKWVDAN